ncbi:MAG: hypothetical protein EHM59_18840 [Betaproteobacteria bacterium]|nr:MAG: hypothetical protein EHM59_18840 [Betaproteobacteria bacterium]
MYCIGHARFLVWDRTRDAKGFEQAFDCLFEGNKRWVKNAPLLLLSIASPDPLSGGRPNRCTQTDIGMAAMSLAQQAVALSLVADCAPLAMIAVGYQASPAVLDEETRKKELAPSGRKPLAERLFESGWSKPVQLQRFILPAYSSG